MALTPGEDPLLFFRLLAEQGPRLLRSGGQLWLELETSLASETMSLFLNQDWVQVRLLPDFAAQMRFLNAVRV
jgi:release factor glutamine methyltransferase